MKRGRNQRRRQGVNPNRALDSNGPEVRIRGTANQIYDKYIALARDASSSGDRVKAESYLQHAEHYFRLIRSMQQTQPQQQTQHEVDGEQPTIEDGDEGGRGNNRGANGRDRRSDQASSADSGDGGDENEAQAGSKNDDDKDGGENGDRKPRRRRTRRPTKQADDDAGADEEQAAAAE